MNQEPPVNNPDASAGGTAKRKRGRPRKYPKPDLNHVGSSHVPRSHTLNRADNARLPPGFEAANGSQPRPGDLLNNANNVMVGQVVSGVIEAAFDAGYLLTVRVGNSDTTLRGVVFKPGHYVPVSAGNDVAPNIQMIRRNEVSLPRDQNEPQINIHRNGAANPFNGVPVANQVPRVASQVASHGASKVKPVSSTIQPPGSLIPRGHVVPVVLQAANVPNGRAVVNQSSTVANQSTHSVAFVGTQASTAANITNGPTLTDQTARVEIQVPSNQPQTVHQAMPKCLQSETAYNQPPPEGLQEADVKSMRSPGIPFEKLLTEVIKRVQPSQEVDAQAGNLSEKDSDHSLEDDQPLSIEPLRAIQPDNSASVLKPLENCRTGKMTELLQENIMENMAFEPERPANVTGETDHGVGGSVDFDKLS